MCVIAMIIFMAHFVFSHQDPFEFAAVVFHPSNDVQQEEKNDNFRWIDIEKDEYSEYYSEYELKSIDTSNPECKKIPNLGTKCCIGGTSAGGETYWAPKQCANKNIFKRFDFEPLSEKEVHSMSDIAVKLDNNSIILSVGDSVQTQLTDLMECNLYNNGFDRIYVHNYTDEESAAFFGIKDTAGLKESVGDKKFCNELDQKCIVIRWLHSYKLNVSALNNFCLWGDVYLMNWSLHYNWYEVYEAYESHLNAIYQKMNECNRDRNRNESKVFVWRERSSQHFVTLGGYYNKYFVDDSIWNEWYEQFTKDKNCERGIKFYNQSTEKAVCSLKNQSEYQSNFHNSTIWSLGCWPIVADEVQKYKWRNFVIDTANAMGIRTQIIYHNSKPQVVSDAVNLFFIPFKDVTDGLWDHHPGECSHYCTTPYLAQYIFHTLYLAISAAV